MEPICASGSCCTDCLFFIVNGDIPWDDAEDEPDHAWVDNFARRNAGYYWVVGCGTEECGHDLDDPDESDAHTEGCEHLGFRAYSQCTTCGSTLGGDRYAITGWETSRNV